MSLAKWNLLFEVAMAGFHMLLEVSQKVPPNPSGFNSGTGA